MMTESQREHRRLLAQRARELNPEKQKKDRKTWIEISRKKNGPNREMKAYRARRGITQETLGNELGFEQATISDYETGMIRTPDYVMDYIRGKSNGD